MSQPPTSHHNPYPAGHGPQYDSRRPSGSFPPQTISERLPPILDQPPRYHASQSYSPYPTYGEGSRMYHAQTPPLPPPVQHPRPDYRYSSLGGLPTPQQSFSNAPPMNDRDYAGYYKKRKLSSDISAYSLSVNNGASEDVHPRMDSYSKNPPTPNISTPSSSERPPEELGATRADDRARQAQMTEQDKHELKKEKNREKQRRLRSRRAEQMNTLEHLNAEKDARLEHLEAKVKQLEAEAAEREGKWQTWVTELESRLTQARRRCKVLEAESMGQKDMEGEHDVSASREIADVRVRFGVEAANGIDPTLSYSTAVISDNMRVDPTLHRAGDPGMYRSKLAAGSNVNEQPRPRSGSSAASPRESEHMSHSNSRPMGLQTSNDRFRHSGSPLSIQALLSPSVENIQSATGSFSTDGTRIDLNAAASQMTGENNTARMMDAIIARGLPQVVTSLEDVDPNVALPYLHLLNSLQPMPNQPSAFPKVAMLRNPETDVSSQVATLPQHSTADSVHAITANMPESEILSMADSRLLHLARSLIQEKLPSSMYTPQQGQWNTTMEDEQSKFNLRKRTPSDAATLVGEDLEASSIRPNWRQVFTPSQLYILYRALMFASHPSGSKEFFDGKRLSELSAGQKAVYERWAAYEGRDKRLDMVPAMILRMRIILCDELQDRGDFDLTAYMSDTLHEAVLYGNAWSMYCWELPDSFWDRWSAIFPAGRDFCSALRAWRRKDRHPGARPFEIIMGTEAPEVRRRGGLELPPVGWSDGLIPDNEI